MRTLERDKQKFYYALFIGEQPEYVLDEDGNKIVEYIDDEGTEYYKETGTTQTVYSEPVEFWASISSELNEIHAREYGVDQSSIYSEIHTAKNYVPLDFEAKIWKKSEIRWLDETAKIPDPDSSDYTVKGILDEYLNFDFYLLCRNN